MKPNTQTGIIIGLSIVALLVVLIAQNNIFIQKSDEPIISQNDLYCGTAWIVQLDTKIDHAVLEKVLRDKIAEFGSVYDIPEREIKIDDIGKNRVKITIRGLWQKDPDVPDLGSGIASIEHVEEIKNSGHPTEAWCQ